jgi:pilus assembly protein CpaE
MTVLLDLDAAVAEAMYAAIGPETTVVPSLEALRRHLESNEAEDAVVFGPTVDLRSALAVAESLRVARPHLGVVLVRRRVDTGVLARRCAPACARSWRSETCRGVNAAVHRTRELARALRHTAGADGAAPAEKRAQGVVVTVFSAKGGCGKTTVATNLAAALADRGRRRVCLVDLDLAFGDVAIALQLFPAHTIADAVPLSRGLDAQAVQALLTPHSPGLTTLVAPIEPGLAETIPAELVGRVLDLCARSTTSSSSTPRPRSTTTSSRPSTAATSSRCSRRWTSPR